MKNRPTIAEALLMPARNMGECIRCPGSRAVACGMRLCAKCNRELAASSSIPVPKNRRYRDRSEREAVEYEPNPWQENAIRSMEDLRQD
jgi:ribosomal protein S14